MDFVASWFGHEVDPVGIVMDKAVKSEFLVDAIDDVFHAARHAPAGPEFGQGITTLSA